MLNDIITYGPIVFACMVGVNALLAGIYTSLSRIVDSAQSYPGNIYLIAASVVCKKIMLVIDIIGMNPQRAEIKKAVEENKADIKEIKNGLV